MDDSEPSDKEPPAPRADSGAPFEGAGGSPRHGGRSAPGGHGERSDPTADLRFSKVVAILGLAILCLTALLVALPPLLEGPPVVYAIAYVIAALFGPVGLSLLAAAIRIRNRALHGTAMPASHRLRLRVLGLVLVAAGAVLALSGAGATGLLSRALDIVWGVSLAIYGIRSLLRSFIADDA